MSSLLSSVRGSYSTEAIFGSGPKFLKVPHPEISASSEGKELCLPRLFADGCLQSHPCCVTAKRDEGRERNERRLRG